MSILSHTKFDQSDKNIGKSKNKLAKDKLSENEHHRYDKMSRSVFVTKFLVSFQALNINNPIQQILN